MDPPDRRPPRPLPPSFDEDAMPPPSSMPPPSGLSGMPAPPAMAPPSAGLSTSMPPPSMMAPPSSTAAPSAMAAPPAPQPLGAPPGVFLHVTSPTSGSPTVSGASVEGLPVPPASGWENALRAENWQEDPRMEARQLDSKDSLVVLVPENLPLERTRLMDLVAGFVVTGGPQLEEDIAAREVNNPHFSFLRSVFPDKENRYYRWKLYSLLQGDTPQRWRSDPFYMDNGPLLWVPPRVGVASRSQIADLAPHIATSPYVGALRAQGLVPRALPELDRLRWCNLLKGLTEPRRALIEERLLFAYDHSYYAIDVLELLLLSMGTVDVALRLSAAQRAGSFPTAPREGESLPEDAMTDEDIAATVAKFLAKLFLLSDIFMNVYASASSMEGQYEPVTASRPLADPEAGRIQPRNFHKAADFVLDRLFEELMAFKEIICDGAPNPGPGSDLNNVSDPAWLVLGWVRELWALWASKAVLPSSVVQRIEQNFAFIIG